MPWQNGTMVSPSVNKRCRASAKTIPEEEEQKARSRRGGGRRQEAYRSVHTQTIYRDSETQTMPCALETTTNLGLTTELLEIAFTANGRAQTPSYTVVIRTFEEFTLELGKYAK